MIYQLDFAFLFFKEEKMKQISYSLQVLSMKEKVVEKKYKNTEMTMENSSQILDVVCCLQRGLQSIFVFAWAHVLVQGCTSINFKTSLSTSGAFNDNKNFILQSVIIHAQRFLQKKIHFSYQTKKKTKIEKTILR